MQASTFKRILLRLGVNTKLYRVVAAGIIFISLTVLWHAGKDHFQSTVVDIKARLEGRAALTKTVKAEFTRTGIKGRSVSENKTWLSYDSSTVKRCLSGREMGRLPKDFKARNVNFTLKIVNKPITDEQSFADIYKNGVWGPNVRSGPGSEIVNTVEITGTIHTIVTYLKTTLKKDKITMLDIPCGDMTWMSRFLASRHDIAYTGMDIVPALIEKHKQTFKNTPHTFINANIVKVGLNKSYDLVFSRMMTQHLFTPDVQKMLMSVSRSGSKYFLTSTFPRIATNQELRVEGYRFREINFELPPYALSPPQCIEVDGPPKNQASYVGLWKLPLRQATSCTKTHQISVGGVNMFSCTKWA